mmetsp:Transcript_121935/g.339922  ORF Transcript_121935/g.339922 Transcript_121935/m.339922 type:complete len:378 (+) Transcript_121935:168-1301(+)
MGAARGPGAGSAPAGVGGMRWDFRHDQTQLPASDDLGAPKKHVALRASRRSTWAGEVNNNALGSRHPVVGDDPLNKDQVGVGDGELCEPGRRLPKALHAVKLAAGQLPVELGLRGIARRRLLGVQGDPEGHAADQHPQPLVGRAGVLVGLRGDLCEVDLPPAEQARRARPGHRHVEIRLEDLAARGAAVEQVDLVAIAAQRPLGAGQLRIQASCLDRNKGETGGARASSLHRAQGLAVRRPTGGVAHELHALHRVPRRHRVGRPTRALRAVAGPRGPVLVEVRLERRDQIRERHELRRRRGRHALLRRRLAASAAHTAAPARIVEACLPHVAENDHVVRRPALEHKLGLIRTQRGFQEVRNVGVEVAPARRRLELPA